jgi:hypothetical protein
MITTVEAPDSGYRFMPGVSQYSCGIGALDGFAIERVRFANPVPLKAGFEKIAEHLKNAERPLTSSPPASCARPRPLPKMVFGPSTRSISRH